MTLNMKPKSNEVMFFTYKWQWLYEDNIWCIYRVCNF